MKGRWRQTKGRRARSKRENSSVAVVVERASFRWGASRLAESILAAVIEPQPEVSKMTIDTGLKPEGRQGTLPHSWRGRPLGRRCRAQALFRPTQDGGGGAFVAGRTMDVVAREANVSVAKLTEWRDRALAGAASALKERERDDREDEIARLKSKVGEITMDNELLSAKIAAIEAKSPLARRRSRRWPDGLTFHVSFLWPGAGLARVECFARRRLSLSQGSDLACDRPSAPVRQAPVGMLTWPITSAGKSERPTFAAKAIANYGRDCAFRGSFEPRRVRRVMGENRLLAPHRVGRNQEKTHDGTIVTDKVNEMWGTDISQTVTIEEGRAYVFVAVEHANSEIIGIHAARSANRFEALEPVRQGCFGASAPSRPAWRVGSSCVTIMAPITCPAISRARSNVWASKLRRPSCANPRAMASPSASSEP